MISQNEARTLFEQHSIFVVNRHVMPKETVINLTSPDAYDHAAHIKNHIHMSGYGIGNYTMFYLDEQGFYLAVTYHNVQDYKNSLVPAEAE